MSIKNIKSVYFKPGYLTGTTETNLASLVEEVLLFQGIPLLNACCGVKKNYSFKRTSISL